MNIKVYKIFRIRENRYLIEGPLLKIKGRITAEDVRGLENEQFPEYIERKIREESNKERVNLPELDVIKYFLESIER